MALDPEEIHFGPQFEDMIVEQVSSSPSRAILPKLASQGNKGGESLFVDTMKNGDNATTEAHSAKLSREQFEAGTIDLANYLKLRTPHKSVVRARTSMAPQEIDWGHVFKRGTDITNVVDPTNTTIQAGIRDVMLQRNRLFIAGLSAAAVNRVDLTSANSTSVVSEAMPASQAFTTANSGFLDVDDFSDILALFEEEYIECRKYILMGTAVKSNLVKNNRDIIKNGDFVNAKTLESGNLPEIEGFTPLVSPLVPAGKFYCFVGEALRWNQFESFSSSLDRIAEAKNCLQSYMVENADCKRIDDLGVVHGTIKA